jgi:hypothetical protein
MKQILDHDLDPFERRQLVKGLTDAIAKTRNPNERNLAKALLAFVRAEDVRLAKQPNRVERTWDWALFIAARWPSRRSLKWLLILGFALAGLSALFQIGVLWAILNGFFENTPLPGFVIQSGRSQYAFQYPILIVIHSIAILITGVLCAAAALMLFGRRERLGLRVGSLALILSLTVVSLLTFYFSQLYAVGAALSQLALLLGATIYRWRFFLNG